MPPNLHLLPFQIMFVPRNNLAQIQLCHAMKNVKKVTIAGLHSFPLSHHISSSCIHANKQNHHLKLFLFKGLLGKSAAILAAPLPPSLSLPRALGVKVQKVQMKTWGTFLRSMPTQ